MFDTRWKRLSPLVLPDASTSRVALSPRIHGTTHFICRIKQKGACDLAILWVLTFLVHHLTYLKRNRLGFYWGSFRQADRTFLWTLPSAPGQESNRMWNSRLKPGRTILAHKSGQIRHGDIACGPLTVGERKRFFGTRVVYRVAAYIQWYFSARCVRR